MEFHQIFLEREEHILCRLYSLKCIKTHLCICRIKTKFYLIALLYWQIQFIHSLNRIKQAGNLTHSNL